MKFDKGSEWRKWDLHVHSPASHNFTGDMDQFKQQLTAADCDVIGINDYFSVAGYKEIKEEIENRNLNIEDKFLLPVVEMRMNDIVQSRTSKPHQSGVTHFNFHIIFSNEINIDDIENFIQGLGHEDTTIASDYSDREKLKDKVVSFNETLEKLAKDSKFIDKYLIWLPYNEYGGIDKINPKTDSFIKENLVKKSDIIGSSNKKTIDFFLWNDTTTTQEEFEEFLGVKKPCIKGSDSHNHNDVIGCLKDKDSKPTNKHCWIKADLTFEGLKAIVHDPENRVYIGEKPPILDRVERNKHKYIQSLSIDQIESCNTDDDIWFRDINIPFNKELVAIIGNKGSGKSSIADILGLLGNTHMEPENFSFLHKDKFCREQDNLASQFQGEITWESDGTSEYKPLNKQTDKNKPEFVRYIPQNYFETLTNKIQITQFQEVLEKIIFDYMPQEKRYNKSNFEELQKYKSQTIRDNIDDIVNEIKTINNEIIQLEEKSHPYYGEKIKNKIEEKNIEIKTQDNLLKKIKEEIELHAQQKEKNITQNGTEIERLNEKIKGLEKNISNAQQEISKTNIEIEELRQIKAKVKSTEKKFEDFINENKKGYQSLGLDINEIYQIKLDYSSIDKLTAEKEKIVKVLNKQIQDISDINENGDESQNVSLSLLKKELQNKVSQLDKNQQAYEKLKQNLIVAGKEKTRLVGNEQSPEPDTLSFLKREQSFIDNELHTKLNEKRNIRMQFALEIFDFKNKMIDFYNELANIIDESIKRNDDLIGSYSINIKATFKLKPDFREVFLNYINQNKRGSFMGKKDGGEKIDEIIKDKSYTKDNVEEILHSIIEHLFKDKRDNEEDRHIKDQVSDLTGFYEYIFSLDYLEPQYELTFNKKTLNRISPGERGALLLIFYLMIDKEDIPLIIDQPEDNLDNESVYNMLSKFIIKAKQKRQIILVTHNPNLAVCADAEQIIHVSIDKDKGNKFSFKSGSIENPEINKQIVQILEGTKPAFDKRKLKYQKTLNK